ncbi:hypothetical protein GCM10010387_03980 [Streptomyces inusitatus]|uniref:Uncharacterized protein n=1 Tax=Streptomyces inusitatus TaxID=68221 RepID=A0A918PL57_9ACTN|nr:hypothetical protein GCM10010387_03980 [Streptomyces inusitatus]
MYRGNIKDEPYRVHRSYASPDGKRRMDTRPDVTLRAAGLEETRATGP